MKDLLDAISEASDAIYFSLVQEGEIQDLAKSLEHVVLLTSEEAAREAALNALCDLSSYGTKLEINWASLLSIMNVIPSNEAEFLLSLIGSSGKPEYIQWLQPYTNHPQAFIREAAEKAILQLKES